MFEEAGIQATDVPAGVRFMHRCVLVCAAGLCAWVCGGWGLGADVHTFLNVDLGRHSQAGIYVNMSHTCNLYSLSICSLVFSFIRIFQMLTRTYTHNAEEK